MDYRIFGRTGLRVSTVSMGCNRLGDPDVDSGAWPPLVERALSLGVTFFDTAGSYNQGRSEAIIGAVTARHPAPTAVSTKVGVPIETNDYANREFSAATILRDVDGHLRRLRREAIDVYLLHSPSAAQLSQGDWAAAFDRLKREGKVRWTGISTSDHASGITAVELGAEALQIEYDLLVPTADDALLPLAQARDVGVMVRTPLARGLLTGKFAVGQPIPPAQQWRRPRGDVLQRRLERVEQLRFLEREGQTLGQAALRFVLAHPGVHCVVPGARTVAQVEANCAAADGALTADELARVRALHAEWRAQDLGLG
jgi:aryl-alcohol dehydrogenase-like predicted oxidoreductase